MSLADNVPPFTDLPTPADEVRLSGKSENRVISIEFSDTSLEAVFRTLGEISRINFVLSPRVAGRVTLRLENVTFYQALNSVLWKGNLYATREDRILLIRPLGE